MLKIGDRIELLAMPDDPCPIPVGSQGTVETVIHVHLWSERFTQVLVKWDSGRTLSLIMPPDEVRVL